MPVQAAIPLILGAVQLGTSIYQGIQSNKARKQAESMREGAQYDPSLNEFEKASLDVAQRVAQERRLPGQNILEQNIQGATSRGIGNIQEMAGSSASALGAASSLYGQEMGAMSDLERVAAEYYANNQLNLQGALAGAGGIQRGASNMGWQYNKYLPYMNAAQMTGKMQESSINNLTGGIGMVGYGLSKMDTSNQDSELYKYTSPYTYKNELGYTNPSGGSDLLFNPDPYAKSMEPAWMSTLIK